MPPAAQRQQWLKALRDLLSNERQALIDAIDQDFSHRSADETLLAELMPSLHCIHYASQHLKSWMKASRRKVGVAFQPASAKVVYQPLGVVGRDRAVELPVVPGYRSAGGRVVGGQSSDAQAQRIDPCHRLAAQGTAGAYLSPRPGLRGAGRNRHRRGLLPAALRSPAVHRRHQRRQTGDARGCREPDTGDP